ncbi:MAG: alpha/beta hydrolase fold domain-containing protein [Opitutaceae bacterium]
MKHLPILSLLAFIGGSAIAQQSNGITFSQVVARHDANKDGVISKAEFTGNPVLFNRMDGNHDGSVNEAEFLAAQKRLNQLRDQSSRQSPARALPADVTVKRDIEYASIDGQSLKLDLYLPKATEATPPLIVWIHGGGWKSGDKANMPPAVLRLSGEGYAIASINYRLKDLSIHPKNIHDCKGAVRWLRAHAETYSYDPERIAVAGSSAGGHLALLLGLSSSVNALEGEVGGNTDQGSSVKAIVDFYGPSELVVMAADSERFKRAHEFTEAQVKDASPLTYLTDKAPPVLIFHGDKDGTVPVGQSQLLHDRYQERSLNSQLHILNGAGHGGPAFTSDAIYEQIKSFLKTHL